MIETIPVNTIATVTVDGQELNIEQGEYGNGKVALFAYDPHASEVYGFITTNLPRHVTKAPGNFFIKDYTATSALGTVLIQNNVIEVAGPTVSYGNFNDTATEYRLVNH